MEQMRAAGFPEGFLWGSASHPGQDLQSYYRGCGSGSLSQVQRRYRTDGGDGTEYIPLLCLLGQDLP